MVNIELIIDINKYKISLNFTTVPLLDKDIQLVDLKPLYAILNGAQNNGNFLNVRILLRDKSKMNSKLNKFILMCLLEKQMCGQPCELSLNGFAC